MIILWHASQGPGPEPVQDVPEHCRVSVDEDAAVKSFGNREGFDVFFTFHARRIAATAAAAAAATAAAAVVSVSPAVGSPGVRSLSSLCLCIWSEN